MKIAEISIKRPTLVIVLFIILTLGGLFSFSQLSYELIPKFEINVITISTVYPGASPGEVENTVTKKNRRRRFLSGKRKESRIEIYREFVYRYGNSGTGSRCGLLS